MNFLDFVRKVAQEQKERFVEKHYGPGPHKSGSPQSVHGGKGKKGKRAKAKAGESKKTSRELKRLAASRGAKSAKYVKPPVSLGKTPTVHELMFKGIYASWRHPTSTRKEDGFSVIMQGRDKKYYAYRKHHTFEVIPTEKSGDEVIAYK